MLSSLILHLLISETPAASHYSSRGFRGGEFKYIIYGRNDKYMEDKFQYLEILKVDGYSPEIDKLGEDFLDLN